MRVDGEAHLMAAGTSPFFASAGAVLHALLRVGAGLLFIQHGVQKLFGWLGGMGGSGASAELFSQMGVAGVLELVGGALLVIGLLTRPIGFLLMGLMASAYAIAHLPKGGLPVENGGELALLYLLVFAFFFGNGAGRYSVDHWLAGRRGARAVPAGADPALPSRRRAA